MKINLVLYLFVIALCCGCASENTKEKRQRKRANIVNVKDKVKEIDTEKALIGSWAQPYICGDYLAIADYKSPDKKVRLFDLHTLKYVLSLGDAGQGPTEITVLGTIAWNEKEHDLYVTDHGQHKIMRYHLDSLLVDSLYVPTVRLRLGDISNASPKDYYYVNDTLAFGSFLVPTSGSSYKWTGGKWNMKTGGMKLIDYVHPSDKKKRISFAFSLPHNTMVECNQRYDLMSLYDLEGNLLYNVYGPNWDADGDRKQHFKNAVIYKDKIIASYIGEDWRNNDGARVLHVFDITGNYLKTLDVGYKMNNLCCDEENDRLIMNLDAEIQFGYLDLKEVMDATNFVTENQGT